MTWPSTPISEAHYALDSDVTDTLAALLLLTQTVNTILSLRAEPGGFASLGNDGTVPATQLSGVAVRTALKTVDGADSLVDADLLDGLEGAEYLQSDGSQMVDITNAVNNFTVQKTTTATDTLHTNTTISNEAPSARGSGFGAALKFKARSAGSAAVDAGRVGAVWLDATDGLEDSEIQFEVANSGSLTFAAAVREGLFELPEVAAPSGDPALGRAWLYMTTSGLVYEDDTGATTTLGGSGASDHGTLTGLNDAADHGWAVDRSGTNGAMLATLDMGPFDISLDSMTPPSAPAANTLVLYNDGDVLKYRTSAGIVALSGTGVTDHGSLDAGSLLDDDHTQYLLRQPTANVVLNNLGSDVDWQLKGVADDNLFMVDAGIDGVGFGTSAVGTHKVAVSGGASGAALQVSSGSGVGLDVATTGGQGAEIAITGDGRGLRVQRDPTASVTQPIVEILENDVTDGALALLVENKSSADIARFTGAGGVSYLEAIAAGVVVNEGGTASVDFRVETGSEENAILVDASADKLHFYGTTASTGRSNFTGGSLHAIYANATASGTSGVFIASSGSAKGITAESTSGHAAQFTSTNGYSLFATRNVALATDPIAVFEASNATDQGIPVLIHNFGTGDYFECNAATTSGNSPIFRVAATKAEPTSAMILEGRAFAGVSVDTVSTPETNWYRLLFRKDTVTAANSGVYLLQDDGTETQLNGGSDGGNVTTAQGATRTTNHFEELVNITSGTSSSVTTTTVPVGSIIERVMVRTVTSPGVTYTVGVEGMETLFATTGVAVTAGSTNLTIEGATDYQVLSTALAVKLKSTAGNFTSNGSVRVTVFYREFTAATA